MAIHFFRLLRPVVLAMMEQACHCEQGLSLRGNPFFEFLEESRF
ncbi:hypothetical protein HFN_0381 [Helicobacter fennelliae MRY12-0050]|uniref:Uncharacterized protein n=1 Tax=Helicobacter fennelliae MRY12-0050 TaxID=1325130 RepID=T1CZ86_9HELI|nr:hypothetical protein HFN_0381 [Helicobacter fennelliae MRY12-0050]